MYSKQEASQLRHEFWTTFGQYMAPVLSAEGGKVSWVNYKTGIKDIFFRMQAGNKTAYIAVELTHADLELQLWYFEELIKYKKILHQALNEEWDWVLHVTNEHGKVISRVYKEQENISIFRKEDWPSLISFFKHRIIALDAFWNEVKYTFEIL